MSNSKSKSIWIYIIGGLFIVFALASINGKTSESTPNNQVKSVTANQAFLDKSETKEEIFTVKRVVDGDTVELENGEKVRYIGINTPESVDPRKAVECFSKEASNKNKELVEGEKVRLEKDVSDRDKYNRLLRYVYLENGIFVNLELVKQGYAQVATYPPDVKFQSDFQKAQDRAKKSKLGLWADNACVEATSRVLPKKDVPKSTPQEDIQPPKNELVPPQQDQNESDETAPIITTEGVIKKSVNDICHAPGTTYYDRTKNFTPYNSIDDCIASGGRLPLR